MYVRVCVCDIYIYIYIYLEISTLRSLYSIWVVGLQAKNQKGSHEVLQYLT